MNRLNMTRYAVTHPVGIIMIVLFFVTLGLYSPDLDASTHSYKVRILLDGDGKNLRGGMFGRSTVMALERKNALYLPKEGVLENNGKKWAFLIDSSHKVKKVEVTTGLYNDDSIEIVTGISEGDRAAVTNISKLKDGMTVDVEGTV